MSNQYTITTGRPASPDVARPFLRPAGLLCAAGAAISAVGAIVTAAIHTSVSADRASYPYTPAVAQFTQTLWTVGNVLILIGVIGLARCGLVGRSLLGIVGIRTAVLGTALLVPAQFSFVFVEHQHENSTASTTLSAAIGIVAVLAGIGLTITGIAILREGVWTGWGRYLALLSGVFVIVVLIPVQGIRPSIFLWPIAGWNVCLALLGLALVGEARRVRAG